MKILIVEDDPIHADRFEMLALQMGYEVVGICDNAFEAISCFHQRKPDLLLLDIHLRGEIDGIQLAEKINQNRPAPVIFVSSLQDNETFERARQIKPAAFIIKPFDTLQLQRAIELAVCGLASSVGNETSDFDQSDLVLPESLFIKVREKLEKVLFENILFVEAEGRYAMLHTVSGRKFAIRIPLSDLEEMLPTDRFARTHRSYLINLQQLQSIDLHEMMVVLNAGTVPLSKGYREQILERLRQV